MSIGQRLAIWPVYLGLKLRQSEFIWQKLTHTEGFVLSQIDGETSYSDIVEIVGMGEHECAEILARLLELGIID